MSERENERELATVRIWKNRLQLVRKVGPTVPTEQKKKNTSEGSNDPECALYFESKYFLTSGSQMSYMYVCMYCEYAYPEPNAVRLNCYLTCTHSHMHKHNQARGFSHTHPSEVVKKYGKETREYDYA